jgi:CDP-diacylglycerol--glycerol-3-phosphate 3-phosphatidyltransferase
MAAVGRSAQVKVSDMGKWKTAVQMLALIGLIWQPISWITDLGMALLYFATVLTLWSMVVYLRAAWQDLKQ